MKNFSDYIVYVDESGDHSLTSIDEDYPIFVLAFSIFDKDTYIKNIVPKFQALKFKYFGHDIVIFHENDIRRRKGMFQKLYTKEIYTNFMNDLSQIIKDVDFKIITCVIDKTKLKQTQLNENPYHIALTSCLTQFNYFINEHNQSENNTHIVVEKRGYKEDSELELEFRRLCDNRNYNLNIVLADKKTNSIGLQLSDMIARPIGRNFINPNENNRAYEIIEKKLYKAKKPQPKVEA